MEQEIEIVKGKNEECSRGGEAKGFGKLSERGSFFNGTISF